MLLFRKFLCAAEQVGYLLGSLVQAEMGLSHRAFGFLTTAFFLVYLCTSPVFGYLGDRWGRLRLMAADNFPDSLVLGHSLARMGAQILLSPSAWAVPADHDPAVGLLRNNSDPRLAVDDACKRLVSASVRIEFHYSRSEGATARPLKRASHQDFAVRFNDEGVDALGSLKRLINRAIRQESEK